MGLLGIAIQTISPLFAEKVKKNWNGKKVAKIYQKLNKTRKCQFNSFFHVLSSNKRNEMVDFLII